MLAHMTHQGRGLRIYPSCSRKRPAELCLEVGHCTELEYKLGIPNRRNVANHRERKVESWQALVLWQLSLIVDYILYYFSMYFYRYACQSYWLCDLGYV